MIRSEDLRSREQDARRFLYKGFDVNRFREYFKQEGISPQNPSEPWITDNFFQAQCRAIYFSVRNQGFCLAMIDRSVFEQGRIERATSMDFERFFDYKGSTLIKWDEIKRLFITQSGLD